MMTRLQLFRGTPPAVKALTDYRNVVVVDPGGNGDYITQAAAAAAITDDDASHVYNVFVFGEAVALATWAGRPYIRVHGRECGIYRATMTQSGTSAPTVTVLENTIGTIVWTRAVTGHYVGTLSGAFASGKTFVSATMRSNSADHVCQSINAGRGDNNSVRLLTSAVNINDGLYGLYDALMTVLSIEIRVYP